jgi:uncharacterized membrane protein
MWTAILLGSLGCYVLKFAGLSVPEAVLQDERVQKVAALLPVALLAALVAIQTFSSGNTLTLDARAAGLGVALIAVLVRLPFLAVVALATATTALLRLL